jgi:hypothetical protein
MFKRLIVLLALVATVSACEGDKDQIGRALAAEGCTSVNLTGYDPWGCSDSDTYSCGFTAVRNGQKVKGVVCSGAWKGATIRYY